MSNDLVRTPDKKNESLVASFHRVKSLIPSEQELNKIPPEMRVSEALKIMKKNHYSQLPVVAGDAVLGVFSFRSFSNKALAKQRSAKQPLSELPVEDFLEPFEYTHINDDWNRVLRYLNQDDAFFVGHSNGLEGMVTTMDMLNYFQEIANPFIMIAEIEQSLRKIIKTCISEAALPEAITRSLKTAYGEGKIPGRLKEMTFDNYVQIISNRENWHYFEEMFGSQDWSRKQANDKLQQLGRWRNTIFHFRRRLEEWELATLAEHREWLHRRVRAFEGRRRKTGVRKQRRKVKVQHKPELTLHPASQKWDEVSFFAELASQQGSEDVVAAKNILKWAQSRVLDILWGSGKKSGSFVPMLHHNGQDHQLFVVWTYGEVEIYFYWLKRKPPFETDEKRLELLGRLNAIPGVSIPRDAIARRPKLPLAIIKEKVALQQFLGIFDWVVQEIQLGGNPRKATQPDSSSETLPKRHIERQLFWSQLLDRAKEKTNLHARISPGKDNWISTGAGKSGLKYSYTIRKYDAEIEMGISTSSKATNKQIFEKLLAYKTDIERSFGASLIWYNRSDKKMSAICYIISDGGLANRNQWAEIQDKMIDAMIRLEKSLSPYIKQL